MDGSAPIVRRAFEPAVRPGRFEEVLAASFAPVTREAFEASNTGKARKALADAAKLADALKGRLDAVGVAMTRGDGSALALLELQRARIELNIAVGQVESLVRLHEAEGV